MKKLLFLLVITAAVSCKKNGRCEVCQFTNDAGDQTLSEVCSKRDYKSYQQSCGSGCESEDCFYN